MDTHKVDESVTLVCMAEVTVAEYAQRYGLAEQIIRRSMRSGAIPGRKSGGVWLIDDAFRHRPPTRRPLAERAASALVDAVDGRSTDVQLRPTELARTRARLRQLHDGTGDTAPADLVRDWLRNLMPRSESYFVPSADLTDLRQDRRVVPGGVSDPRSEISAPDFLEAHIAANDLDRVRRDYLLRSSASPNVKLHVHAAPPDRPLPLSQLILDLAADDGPRERRRVAELLRTVTG